MQPQQPRKKSTNPNTTAAKNMAESKRKTQQLQNENAQLRSQIKKTYNQSPAEDPRRDAYLQELTWAEQSQKAIRFPVLGSNEKTALIDVPVRFDITSATTDGYVALRADPLHLIEAQFDLAVASVNNQFIDICDPTGVVGPSATFAGPMNNVSIDCFRVDWNLGSQMDIQGAPPEYSYAYKDGSKFVLLQAGATPFVGVTFPALASGNSVILSVTLDRFDGDEIEDSTYSARGFTNTVSATTLSINTGAVSLGWYRFKVDCKIIVAATGAYVAGNLIVNLQVVNASSSRYIVNYAAPNITTHVGAIQACRVNYLGGVLKNVSQEINKGGRVAVARFQGQPLDLFNFNVATAYTEVAGAADSLNMSLVNGVFTFLPFGGPNTLDFEHYFAPPENGSAFSDSQSPLQNARKAVIIAWQSPAVAQSLVIDMRLKLEFLTSDPWFERAFATLDPTEIVLFNAAMLDSQRVPIACENDKHASILRAIRQGIRDMRKVVREGKLLYNEVVPARGRRVVDAILG